MRIKKEPKKPERSKLQYNLDLDSDQVVTLLNLIIENQDCDVLGLIYQNILKITKPSIEDITNFDIISHDYYDDSNGVTFKLYYMESDESYNVRLKLYEEKLKEHKKWKKDNKEEIKKELEKRSIQAKQRKKEKKEKIQNQIRQLRERMAKL